MNGAYAFGTFGLPAIAIVATLIALRMSQRSAARIDAAEAEARRHRAAGE